MGTASKAPAAAAGPDAYPTRGDTAHARNRVRQLAPGPQPATISSMPASHSQVHPVVWAKERAGPLSSQEMEAFDRDGFLLLDRLFSADEVRCAVVCGMDGG